MCVKDVVQVYALSTNGLSIELTLRVQCGITLGSWLVTEWNPVV